MIINLWGGFFQIGNKICSIFLFLQSCIDHFCARNVFLGISQIHVQGVLVPGDALVLVCLGVGVPSRLSSLATKHPVEVGPLLVLASSLYCVTLGTGLGEYLLAKCCTHGSLMISILQLQTKPLLRSGDISLWKSKFWLQLQLKIVKKKHCIALHLHH